MLEEGRVIPPAEHSFYHLLLSCGLFYGRDPGFPRFASGTFWRNGFASFFLDAHSGVPGVYVIFHVGLSPPLLGLSPFRFFRVALFAPQMFSLPEEIQREGVSPPRVLSRERFRFSSRFLDLDFPAVLAFSP